jgi:hypothetical protein
MNTFDKVSLELVASTNPTLNMFITNNTHVMLNPTVKIISVSCTDIITSCFNLRVNAYLFSLILHFVNKQCIN